VKRKTFLRELISGSSGGDVGEGVSA
jgi:hypothetical protein